MGRKDATSSQQKSVFMADHIMLQRTARRKGSSRALALRVGFMFSPARFHRFYVRRVIVVTLEAPALKVLQAERCQCLDASKS